MRRIIIGAATCALLTMIYVPKIEYVGRSEWNREYSLLFQLQKNTEVDLKQLVLNVLVAAVVGGIIGAAPAVLLRRVALALAVIVLIAVAATAVIVPITAWKEAPERARADEENADQLYLQRDIPAAVVKLHYAAENWRIARRPDEEKRLTEKAIAYAREASALRARADETYARQLVREGRLELAKEKLQRAAENWHHAGNTEQQNRLNNLLSHGKYWALFLTDDSDASTTAPRWEDTAPIVDPPRHRDIFDDFLDAPERTPAAQEKPKKAERVKSASAYLDGVDASPTAPMKIPILSPSPRKP